MCTIYSTKLTAMIIHLAIFYLFLRKLCKSSGFFIEKQIFKYDDIGIVSRVSVNGRLFVVPKEELDGLVSIRINILEFI